MSSEVVIQNFIDGEFHDPLSGAWMDTIEPATGKAFGRLADSGAADVSLAVSAARRAFPQWARTGAEERARILSRVADLIHENADALARAESRDTGKPVSLARTLDIPRSEANFRFFAGAILHHEDMSTVMANGSVNYVVSQPIGVAGLISPWNLPLYLLTWKIAPAIATGNVCVCKPSEFTSYSAFLLCSLLAQAGVPRGVVNVVFGAGATAGAALLAHPDVALLSFTGGTVTGRKVALAAAQAFKKVSLELGGKNPNIIFDDCDLEKTVDITRSIYDKFLEKFVAAAAKWKVGDPESDANMGAVISQQHLEKITHYINLAKNLGGKIEFGGERLSLPGRCEQGYFISPCIITGLSQDSPPVQEEIFGPVVTLIPFDTEEEVIALANDTPFGLSCTVFTQDVGRANRVALGVDAATVWVNCWLNRDLRVPFGGVKNSGMGREGGKFSLDFYTEKKTVCVKFGNRL